MTQEEKARAYDEALKRSKAAIDVAADKDLVEGVVKTIFPQLQESEDERIRKEIIHYILYKANGVSEKQEHEWIAYLEKQKEQKPANNNKSEMSDENGHLTGKILVEYGAHAKVRDGKRHCEMEWKEFQRLAHYFYELGKAEQKPVQTADEKEYIRIIKSLIADFIRDKKPEDVAYYQKIYDWLDGISSEQKPVPISCSQENGTPAEWSEEDEAAYNAFICEVVNEKMNPTIEQVKWLRSIRDRLKSLYIQPKQELTLLDENIINAAIAFVEQNDHFNCWGGIDKHTVITALRSLKSSWKPSEEQIYSLGTVIKGMGDVTVGSVGYNLKELYEQLKELM